MTLTPELLPCPFCGRQPKTSSRVSDYTDTKMVHFVACFCGGYSACAHRMGESETDAANQWNTRNGELMVRQ